MLCRKCTKGCAFQLELQVSCSVCAQATAQDAVWPGTAEMGEVFHALARQKECQIIEGHLLPDHVHMCIVIPPKYPVASVIGFLRRKMEERHCDGPLVWQRAEFHGRAVLGPWIRSVHSGL